jgi:class 3 adenylate cyclase/tetratricopeptide (TPR) repeat protein
MLRDLRARMPTALVDKIAQATSDLSGQRREVTVVFVDIVNFSAASQTIDNEDLYLAVDEIMNLLADLVYKYEGTIDKFTGDGLMALFGIPLNHENDPERAVRAALEMKQSMARWQAHLHENYNFDFQIRIGINTGTVVAGHLGSQQHLEYTVIGDTVNLASRLVHSAEPGMVLVSFSTYQRSRPIFEYIAAPTIKVDDRGAIQAYQPVDVHLKPGELRGVPGFWAPMIGRSKHITDLLEAYQQVKSGHESRIVLCSGEAGIGKSRLIGEFRKSLNGEKVRFYQGTCAAYMRITPYRVVADVLRTMIGVSEVDDERIQIEALGRYVRHLGLEEDSVLPYLLHALGLWESDPLLEMRFKLLEPNMLQKQTHLALRSLLTAEARQSPTVLVFDDLHWVDQASRQFLEYFCQALDGNEMLLVLISRDFENFEHVQDIYAAAHKHVHKPVEIRIQPLTQSESHQLVEMFISESNPAANKLKNLISNRSGGNPYYAEELLRVLIDHGKLVQQNEQWVLAGAADDVLGEVPGTLQDIILARFDRLEENKARLLQQAAILGQSFATSLLASISNIPAELMQSILHELEERDFLIHTQFVNEDGYLFKHPLLQETIYNTLLKRDLRKYHTQIAQAIETGRHWLPGERNEVLAHHFAASTTPQRAIPYLLASAEKASYQFANESVVQLYRQALDLMATTTGISKIQKDRTIVGLAQALKFSGEFEEAIELLNTVVVTDSSTEEHIQDAERTQLRVEGLRELADIRAREGNLDYAVDLLNQGLELLGEAGRDAFSTLWRKLVDRLAWVYFRQGKLEEAQNLANLGLKNISIGEKQDPITLASLYNTLGGIYWTRSLHEEAIASVERSLAIYRELNYQWGVAISLTNLGVLHYSLGKWNEAIQHLEQADKMRSEYGYDPERPIVLKNLGELLISLGDFDRAENRLKISREISQRLGMDIYKIYAELGLCRLNIYRENYPHAEHHLNNAKSLLTPLDIISERGAQFFNLKAYLEYYEKNYQEAKLSAERAMDIAEQVGHIPDKIEAQKILGMIKMELRQFEEAETHFQESIEISRTHGEEFDVAKSLFELGKLYLVWGAEDPQHMSKCRDQAEWTLDAAIKYFQSLGARYHLRLATEVRMQLSA